MNQLDPTQAGLVQAINENFRAVGMAEIFGIKSITGLTLALYGGYYGGILLADQTITLAASAANFVEALPSTGVASVNSTGFTSGSIPLYEMPTNTIGPTGIVQRRALTGYFVTP